MYSRLKTYTIERVKSLMESGEEKGGRDGVRLAEECRKELNRRSEV